MKHDLTTLAARAPRPARPGVPGSRALPAVRRARAAVLRRFMLAISGDAGMSTVEYAVGTPFL